LHECDHDYEARAEGAPCGIDGCMTKTCCMDKWKEHRQLVHKNWSGKVDG